MNQPVAGHDPAARIAASLHDRYRIERLLGTGGMATVFLAQDSRHDRRVALKILKPELAAAVGAERFVHEIRTTAALQHPHILGLIDSGEDAGLLWYVMPYVEGESLRDRLDREKQLPVAEAIRISLEVAGALDYAHRRGVIHRDIKPENILLHDGRALVADFGIALAVSSAGGRRLTESGVSVGTPAYMSPEQALGDQEVTPRSDIYALGAVLYEMLLGEPPFTGPTAQAVLAHGLTEDPRPLRRQRRTIPLAVERAVLTALEKLPADRQGSAAEFASQLTAPETRGTMLASPFRLGVAAAAATLLAAGFGAGRMARLRAAVPFAATGRISHITWEPGLEIMPSLSPDGRYVAYAAGSATRLQIFVRQIGGGRPTPLIDDTTVVQSHPRWSRDGSRILFLADGRAYSAPAGGGQPRQEIPDGFAPIRTAEWSPDGSRIAFAIGDTLYLREADGNVRMVATLLEPALCSWGPSDQLACSSGNVYYLTPGLPFGNLSPSRIVIIRLSDGRVTAEGDSTAINQSPVWSADGRWLFFLSNRLGTMDLYAMPVGRGGTPAGPARRVTTGLGAQSISLSAGNGRLVYAAYTDRANIFSVALRSDRTASIGDAVQVTRGLQIAEEPHVSRDGHWLLYDSDLAGNADIYRLRLPDGLPERLTTDPSDEFAPDLSPDGREIAYHSWRSGTRDIYVLPLDGGPISQVTATPIQEMNPLWSPDGSALVYQINTRANGGIVIARRQQGGGWTSEARLDRGFWPAWSPDGRFLAYSTAFLGGDLMIMATDSGLPRRVVDGAAPGGPRAERPYWSSDGRILYFNSHDDQGTASAWSVPVTGGVPRQVLRFDHPDRPSYRPEWVFAGGRAYFPIADQQSDLWLLELTRK